MNLEAAKNILVDRIGWDNDGTIPSFTPSVAAATSNSGRFFQDEHPAVTLENLRDCQPVEGISDADFNVYLEKLKTKVVLQVLDDAFEKDYLDDKLLTYYPTGFDSAILLRMVIVVAEIIMVSSRSNELERMGKSFIGKLNYDIYREAPNKFAIRGANYKSTLGVATRYGVELDSVQRRFGQTKLLKTITKGAISNPNIPLYFDNENPI